MKRTYIAAAALLLGTSVIAWAQSDPADPGAKDPALATTIVVKPTVAESIAAKEARPIDQAKAVAADPEAADMGATDISDSGVGGPVETAEVTTTAAAELTPRPATHNYPPCRPGPGDDNCIQLYEPGVRMALAGWNQPTGGLVDHAATTAMGGPYEPLTDEQIAMQSGHGDATAMGGPYEPVDEASEDAWAGDGVIDAELGETAATD